MFDDIYKNEYDVGDGILARPVVGELIRRGFHISFAESCTGGWCAAELVGVADASRVFNESYVTYANESKISLLGVSEKTVSKYGVVSSNVAGEMAKGVALSSGAEIGVGISGIAGPAGGSPEKPVGTVSFGFYIEGKVHTFTEHFGAGGRNKVRRLSVAYVYKRLAELLGLV